MSEKTEKASPFKLKKAKERGQVAKSNELNTILTLFIFCLLSLALWQQLFNDLLALFKKIIISSFDFHYSITHIHGLFYALYSSLLSHWLPFALAIALSIILSTIGQTGFVWSVKPLVPDFRRLNPVMGMKRIFSVRLFFDLSKNVTRLPVVLITAVIILYGSLSKLIYLIYLSPQKAAPEILHLILKILFHILLGLSVIACLDALYTHWKYRRDQRMSKQEIRDEYKQREGDPKIKRKIKQSQQQMREKMISLNQVKQADVIVTNPTSLAIALKYERGLMPAPKVLCKGQGEIALQIRKIALQNQIPIIEHVLLARTLFREIHLNHSLKPIHFAMAAEVFREVYRLKGKTYGNKS
ncbi:EscU/YscU/HrcU family type III secretion system export apparatus switch protein [Legionella israelensis]|uniref:Flagellar biosynthetic protein FlhB n=1 Tax=Legionella israelensis TaxID=454 RepID=A0AAX1EFZ4_9GAMM|nr:EscU/YscU/HrcU family type III secretion system export apparatus switch protein [Legionella israelensis]QBR84001.1 EscU/YscU/HrcU family type III secretion system export apparatus switch protein [Legionella israelensis]